MDFEKKLARLEELVLKMEKGDLSLEDSMKYYEEGIKLSHECHVNLNEAENRVKILSSMDDNGKPQLSDFNMETK